MSWDRIYFKNQLVIKESLEKANKAMDDGHTIQAFFSVLIAITSSLMTIIINQEIQIEARSQTDKPTTHPDEAE